jgi:O-antigen ligase
VLRASFWNRNTYATFAVFGALANVTVYMWSVSGTDAREGLTALRDFLEAFFAGGWLFAFGALVGLVAVAMTLSRAGSMAGVIGMVVLLWALRRRQVKVGLALLAIPVALFAFVALFMTSGVVDRLERIGDDGRFAVFGQAVEGIRDRPLLGHGAGAFPEAFRPYAPAEYAFVDWPQAHNSYLENAFEFGLPAAAVFYLVLALVGWRLLRGVLTRRRNQSIPAFALACFAAAAFHSIFDFSLQIPAIPALLAAILGIGWAQSFPSRQSQPGEARRPREDVV